MALDDTLQSDATALEDELVQLRHELHRHPEIGLDLPRTQQTLLRELDGLGLDTTLGESLSSITAVLRGTAGGSERRATVLLRGDMDALPVQEQTGVEFSSEIDGAMHACGHDLHMTMLVGAARLLAAHRDALHGDVVFMFQPGEEGWDGAGHMIAEGVLDAAGRRVDSAYGMHVVSAKHPRGMFVTRPGTLMAASDQLEVTVRGAGAHGSTPHLGRDPISTAAEIVSGLHALITRRFNVFDPVVLTVGTMRGGTKRNIIPDDAWFDATIRTFSVEARRRMHEEAPRLCEHIAAAHGLEVDVAYREEYPVTVNAAEHAAFAAEVAREVFGDEHYRPLEYPDTGAEDFSRILAEVPGCYLFLGAVPEGDYRTAPSNHSPRAAFSDSVLPLGTLLHAQLAIRALARDSGAKTATA
jgi:hippurate hydrolase